MQKRLLVNDWKLSDDIKFKNDGHVLFSFKGKYFPGRKKRKLFSLNTRSCTRTSKIYWCV